MTLTTDEILTIVGLSIILVVCITLLIFLLLSYISDFKKMDIKMGSNITGYFKEKDKELD
ncbi:MAG: hypothetical protein HZR80_10425 [Candidatus Heimdallarchaeota archaeon]